MPACANDSASDGYAGDDEDWPKRRIDERGSGPAMNVDGTPMATRWTDVNGDSYGMPRSWSSGSWND